MNYADIFNDCKTGVDFENRIVDVFRLLGFKTTKTGSNDGGIDIIVEGTADCANNIEITINGEIYNYHSDCGTFNDNIKQQSLSLDDTTKEKVNVMIAEYISLTATEIIVE